MAKALNTFGGGHGDPNGIGSGIKWAEADYKTDGGRRELADAMDGYLKDLRAANDKTMLTGADRYGMKFTRPGHLPGGLPDRPDVDVNFYGPQDDSDVFSLFRYADKRGSKNPTYQFASVNANGLVVEQLREGQEARIRKVSGATPASLSSITWGGAIGIDDDAKRFDDYGIFEQNLQTAPSIYRDKQATTLAALFTALGAGVNEAWATDLITTINNGCAQILEDVGDVLGLPDNPQFALMYNHRRASLVRQALVSDLTLPNDNNSGNQLEFNITPVKTRKITSASMYLCIPGHDIILAEWDELGAEFGRDPFRRADAHIYTGRWNAGIGNTGQVRRITPA